MSDEVNKNAVFRTTRVRTQLKKDGCWIQKSNTEKAGARKGHDVETSSVPQHTSVQSITKKFEPQAPTEEMIQKNIQSEETFANMTAKNKKEYAAVYQSKVQPLLAAADVSAEVHVAKPIQIPSTERKPEAVSLVKPAEQAVANTTTENKGEKTNKIVNKSNLEHSEAKVSADAHVDDPKAETCVASAVKPKPKEEPATKPEQDTATQLEHAGVQSTVQLAEGNIEKGPLEQAAAEIVKAKAEVAVAPSPEISDVVATLVKEVVLQDSAKAVAEIATKSPSNTKDLLEATPGNKAVLEVRVEPVADLLAEPESEGPSQQATETAPKGNCEKGPPEQAAAEIVKAKAEVAVAPSPEISDVVNAILVKEVVLQDSAKAVAEIATKSPSNTKDLLEATPGNKAALEVCVEPVADLLAEPESEGPSQQSTESAPKGNCEKGPPEQAAGESVEAKAEVAVESSPVTPPVTRGAGEKAPLPVNPDTASESLATAAAETLVKPEAFGVEAGLKTGAEEVVEHEVQPVDNAVIQQSAEPTTERAADHVRELIIKDASEPVTSSDVEAVEDKFTYRLNELSKASDEEPPTTEMAPEPLKDPKRSEETKLNQHPDDTNRNSNVCSLCEKRIAGKIKIFFSEPAWTCHPECLKCCVCTKPLGDFLTPMFWHDQGVQCDTCFAQPLNTKT
ncbi:zinc finger protein 185 [Pungitius pungitius]|uniref:zinc finger protein 185 n=1 Tax=Pungitius pungitius TaxID=134920 RepID=UPI002E1306FC